MSMRTIVEFNHDLGREIDARPDEFVALILEMIRGGVNGNPENKRGAELEYQLSRFGVRTTPTCHHSEDRRVILGRHTYIEL